MDESRLSHRGVVLVLVALALPGSWVHAGASDRIAILAGTVMPIAGPALSPAMVLISDGKIEAVQPGTEAPPGYKRIDAAGRFVLPGLVDAHTHYGLKNASGRFDVAENSAPFTPEADIRDAIDPGDPAFEKVRSLGVTTLVVLPGSSNLISGLGYALKNREGGLETMLIGSKPVLKFALGMNPKSAHGRHGRSPKTRMAATAMLREKLEAARRYVARSTSEPPGDDEPTEPDRELEVLAAAIAGETLVHIHAGRADDVLTAIRLMQRFGLQGSIGHCYEGYLIAEEIAAAGVPVVIGPRLDGWYRGTDAPKPLNLGGRLREAGVAVSIMTDSYIPDLFAQAIYAVHLGMSEDDALLAITLSPARAMGLGDRVGSLEPGKDADLIVLDGPPLRMGTHVTSVWIEGDIVYERAP